MKKTAFIFLFFLFVFIFPIRISAQDSSERIDDFRTTLKVNTDGTIDVEERILYNFGSEYKHGIYRDIPFIRNIEGKKYKMDFSFQGVTDESEKNYSYKKIEEGEVVRLKIGDADKTISGQHLYIIRYTVAGALSYLQDHDEIYWNATGNVWDVPIYSSSFIVSLPSSIPQERIEVICFTGQTGNTEKECRSEVNGKIISISALRQFVSYEGLTGAVSFPKGLVVQLEPKEVIHFFDTPIGKIVGSILVVLLILTGIFWYLIYPCIIIVKWYMYGRDPDVGKDLTSWYDAPKTKDGRFLTPGESGTLVDEKADQKDIIATIIDLARKGYLKIDERVKKDFYFVRTNKTGGLLKFEQQLLDEIFKSATEIHLKDADFYSSFERLKKKLYQSLIDEGFLPKDFLSIRTFYTVIGSLAVFTLNLHLALIAFVFGRNMPRKTLMGAQCAKTVRSLRNFLNSQERQMNFQGEKQLFFEKLLPFAVAMGIEGNWIKRFEQLGGIQQPTWYSGYPGSHFTTAAFVSSLHDTTNSVMHASAPPSSSSSGFSGGSSGGGGGGGGGGSW